MSELTEQEQAQLNEAINKVHAVGVAVIAQSQYAEKAVTFIEHLQYNVDQVVQPAFTDEPKADCKAGCAHCCKDRTVEIGFPEAFYMAQQIKALPEAKQQDIVTRLSKTVEIQDRGEPIPECSFLENNQCMIYDIRPSVCRKAHSQDVNACINNTDIPQNLNVVLSAEALIVGTQRAYDTLGYVAESRELNRVMYAALTEENMLTDWYKVYLEKQKEETAQA